jgi:hypothetical protein
MSHIKSIYYACISIIYLNVSFTYYIIGVPYPKKLLLSSNFLVVLAIKDYGSDILFFISFVERLNVSLFSLFDFISTIVIESIMKSIVFHFFRESSCKKYL